MMRDALKPGGNKCNNFRSDFQRFDRAQPDTAVPEPRRGSGKSILATANCRSPDPCRRFWVNGCLTERFLCTRGGKGSGFLRIMITGQHAPAAATNRWNDTERAVGIAAILDLHNRPRPAGGTGVRARFQVLFQENARRRKPPRGPPETKFIVENIQRQFRDLRLVRIANHKLNARQRRRFSSGARGRNNPSLMMRALVAVGRCKPPDCMPDIAIGPAVTVQN